MKIINSMVVAKHFSLPVEIFDAINNDWLVTQTTEDLIECIQGYANKHGLVLDQQQHANFIEDIRRYLKGGYFKHPFKFQDQHLFLDAKYRSYHPLFSELDSALAFIAKDLNRSVKWEINWNLYSWLMSINFLNSTFFLLLLSGNVLAQAQREHEHDIAHGEIIPNPTKFSFFNIMHLNDSKIVYSYIKQNADIHEMNVENGDRPLHQAARLNSIPIARALLKAGADPLAQNFQGHMAYEAAFQNGNMALAQLLLEANQHEKLPSEIFDKFSIAYDKLAEQRYDEALLLLDEINQILFNYGVDGVLQYRELIGYVYAQKSNIYYYFHIHKNTDKAIDELINSLGYSYPRKSYYIHLLNLLKSKQDHTRGLQYAKEALSYFPTSSHFVHSLLSSHVALNQIQEAFEFTETLSMFPSNIPIIREVRGAYYYSKQDYVHALAEYELLLQSGATHAEKNIQKINELLNAQTCTPTPIQTVTATVTPNTEATPSTSPSLYESAKENARYAILSLGFMFKVAWSIRQKNNQEIQKIDQKIRALKRLQQLEQNLNELTQDLVTVKWQCDIKNQLFTLDLTKISNKKINLPYEIKENEKLAQKIFSFTLNHSQLISKLKTKLQSLYAHTNVQLQGQLLVVKLPKTLLLPNLDHIKLSRNFLIQSLFLASSEYELALKETKLKKIQRTIDSFESQITEHFHYITTLENEINSLNIKVNAYNLYITNTQRRHTHLPCHLFDSELDEWNKNLKIFNELAKRKQTELSASLLKKPILSIDIFPTVKMTISSILEPFKTIALELSAPYQALIEIHKKLQGFAEERKKEIYEIDKKREAQEKLEQARKEQEELEQRIKAARLKKEQEKQAKNNNATVTPKSKKENFPPVINKYLEQNSYYLLGNHCLQLMEELFNDVKRIDVSQESGKQIEYYCYLYTMLKASHAAANLLPHPQGETLTNFCNAFINFRDNLMHCFYKTGKIENLKYLARELHAYLAPIFQLYVYQIDEEHFRNKIKKRFKDKPFKLNSDNQFLTEPVSDHDNHRPEKNDYIQACFHTINAHITSALKFLHSATQDNHEQALKASNYHIMLIHQSQNSLPIKIQYTIRDFYERTLNVTDKQILITEFEILQNVITPLLALDNNQNTTNLLTVTDQYAQVIIEQDILPALRALEIMDNYAQSLGAVKLSNHGLLFTAMTECISQIGQALRDMPFSMREKIHSVLKKNFSSLWMKNTSCFQFYRERVGHTFNEYDEIDAHNFKHRFEPSKIKIKPFVFEEADQTRLLHIAKFSEALQIELKNLLSKKLTLNAAATPFVPQSAKPTVKTVFNKEEKPKTENNNNNNNQEKDNFFNPNEFK